jgi:hypothetical protein
MPKGALVTAIITVALAFIGYIATYVNNMRINQRQARLDRVNRQLSELYGPLLATVESVDRVWRYFVNKYQLSIRSEDSYIYFAGKRADEADLEIWRIWLKTVFMPSNRRLYKLVLSKADLLRDNDMPDDALDLCAHVLGYEVILGYWAAGKFHEHFSIVDYPTSIISYARESFHILKREQELLLGKRSRSS